MWLISSDRFEKQALFFYGTVAFDILVNVFVGITVGRQLVCACFLQMEGFISILTGQL